MFARRGTIAVAMSCLAACATTGGGGLMPPSGDQPTVRHTAPFPTQADLRARALGELSRGRVAAAEASIRRALVQEPEDLPSLVILARVLGQQGHHEDALRLYGFVEDAAEAFPAPGGAATADELGALAGERRDARFDAVEMTLTDGRLLAAASWLAEDARDNPKDASSRGEELAARLAVAWLDAGAIGAGCEAADLARGRAGGLVKTFCAGRAEPGKSFASLGRADGVRVGSWLQAAGRASEADTVFKVALADGAESAAEFAATARLALGAGDGAGAAAAIIKAVGAETNPAAKRALFLAACQTLATRGLDDVLWTLLEAAFSPGLGVPTPDVAIALAYFAMADGGPKRAGLALAGAVGDSRTKGGAAAYDALLTAGAWDVLAEWATQPKAADDPALALAGEVAQAKALGGKVADANIATALTEASRLAELGTLGQLMAGQLRRFARLPSRPGAPEVESLVATATQAKDYVRLVAALPSTRERALAVDLARTTASAGALVAMLGELEAGTTGDGDRCLALAVRISAGGATTTPEALAAVSDFGRLCFAGTTSDHFAAATRLAGHLSGGPKASTPVRLRMPLGLGSTVPQMEAWRQDLVASMFGIPYSVPPTPESGETRIRRGDGGLAARIFGDTSRGYVAEIARRGSRSRSFVAGADVGRSVAPEQLDDPVALVAFAKAVCADSSDDLCARYLDAVAHMRQREVPGLAKPMVAELGAVASERGLHAQALALTSPHGRNDWNSLAVAAIALNHMGRGEEAQGLWRGLLEDRRIGVDGLGAVGRVFERRGELGLAREIALAQSETRNNRAGAVSRVLDLSWRLGDRQFMVAFARAACLADGQNKDVPTLALRRLLDAGMHAEALEIVQAMAADKKIPKTTTSELALEVALVARDAEAAGKAIDALQGYARRGSELVQLVTAVISRGFDSGGDAIVSRFRAELALSTETGLARVRQVLAAGRPAEAAILARELLQGDAWSREAVSSVEEAFLDAGQPSALAGILATAPGAAGRQGIGLARALARAGDLAEARTVLAELDTSSGAARELVGSLWREAGFHTMALAALPTHEDLWAGDVPKEALEALFVSAAAAGIAPPFAAALEAAASAGRDISPETLTALSALARQGGLPEVAKRLSALLEARSGSDADAVERAADATRAGDHRAAIGAWVDRTDVLAGAVSGRGGQPVGVHVALADTFARIAALGPPHAGILAPILGVFEGRLRKGPEGNLVDLFRAWRAVLTEDSPSSEILGRVFKRDGLARAVTSAFTARAVEAIVAELVDRGLLYEARLVAEALASTSASQDIAVLRVTTAARAGYPEEVLALLEAPTQANLSGQGWGLLGALTNVGMPRLAALLGRDLPLGARVPSETNVLAAVGAAFGLTTTDALSTEPPHRGALAAASDTLGLHFARGDWASVLETPAYLVDATAGTNSEDAERISRVVFVAGTPNQRAKLLDAAQRSRAPSEVALTDLHALATLLDAPAAAGEVLERQLASRPADGALHERMVAAAILTAAPEAVAGALGRLESLADALEPRHVARIVDLLAFSGAIGDAKRIRTLIPAKMDHLTRIADLSLAVAAGDREAARAALGGDGLGQLAPAREAVAAAIVAGSFVRTAPSAAVVGELFDGWQASAAALTPIRVHEAALRAALTLADGARYDRLLATHRGRWPTATPPADLLTTLVCLAGTPRGEGGWAERADALVTATLQTDLLEAHEMLTLAFAGDSMGACGAAWSAPKALGGGLAAQLREAFSLRDALPVAVAAHLFFGDASGAVSLVDEARARIPRATETLLAAGEVALRGGRAADALETAVRIAGNPTDRTTKAASASMPFSLERAQAFRLRGEAAKALGDLPAATRWLKAAQMTAPRTARVERALLQLEFSRLEEARGQPTLAASHRGICRALAPTMLACDRR